jgi:hypothetical protein
MNNRKRYPEKNLKSVKIALKTSDQFFEECNMGKLSVVITGLMLAGALLGAKPVKAETQSARFQKLEERVRSLETRMAQLEGDTHKGHMMQYDKQGMAPRPEGTGHPMGQAPQGGMPQQQGGGMEGEMPMPQGGGMGGGSAGGMGHM